MCREFESCLPSVRVSCHRNSKLFDIELDIQHSVDLAFQYSVDLAFQHSVDLDNIERHFNSLWISPASTRPMKLIGISGTGFQPGNRG